MEWFKNARLGMFVHFGLYSTTKGFWNGEEVYFIGEWIQSRFRIPCDEYREKTVPLMTLEGFNAKDYVDLAVKSGMKYIVFTTKHHEGFALFDSKVSEFNVTNLCTPNRDPMKELADECHKQGIKVCFYYSHALDWADKNAFGNDWDFKTEEKDFEVYLNDKCLGQLSELLTNYGDVAMIWFDMPRGVEKSWAVKIRDHVKKLQPNCMINGRLYIDSNQVGDFFSTGDNEIPFIVHREGVWESVGTHNNTWGYKERDKNFRTSRELLNILVDLLSKNANYMPNIGPDELGQIPQETVRDFSAMGDWVKKYAEAVYGTEGSPFDYEVPWGKISSKENLLFLYVQGKTDGIELFGLNNTITSAVNLETGEALEFSQEYDEEKQFNKIKVFGSFDGTEEIKVVKLVLNERVNGKKGFYQQPDKNIQLFCACGEINAPNSYEVVKEKNTTENLSAQEAEKDNSKEELYRTSDKNGVIRQWMTAQGDVTMKFTVYEPGDFDVFVATRPKKYQPWIGGHTVSVTIADKKVSKVLTEDIKINDVNTRCYDDTKSFVGKINIEKAGDYTLVLEAQKINAEEEWGFTPFRIDLVNT